MILQNLTQFKTKPILGGTMITISQDERPIIQINEKPFVNAVRGTKDFIVDNASYISNQVRTTADSTAKFFDTQLKQNKLEITYGLSLAGVGLMACCGISNILTLGALTATLIGVQKGAREEKREGLTTDEQKTLRLARSNLLLLTPITLFFPSLGITLAAFSLLSKAGIVKINSNNF